MIRLIYGLLVTIEIIILLFTMLLFIMTDSGIVHIATKDILAKYHISYDKISGNLFTGIEIKALKYQEIELVGGINVHWNPMALIYGKLSITKLSLEGVEPLAIMKLVEKLPSSDSNKSVALDFDIAIKRINLTANPFVYYGVAFKNFHLGSSSLKINRALLLESDVFNLSVDSDLVNLELRGKIEGKEIAFDGVRLMDIDPKVITLFVRNINKKSSKEKIATQITPTQSSSFPFENITVDNFFATMKKTTYSPITIDKTKVVIRDMRVNPKKLFEINAKSVTLSTDTSFASTVQKGSIKNSMLYTTGDVLPTNYLYDLYSLPLNRQGLKRLPAKLKLNHKGLWVDISHEVQNLLTLKNSNFNIDLKNTTHRLDYRYLDFNMTIASKSKGKISYADEVDIKSLVVIDFNNEPYTFYKGDVTLNAIKNIPAVVHTNFLQDLKANYRGDSKGLLVNIDSKQIEGNFLTKGYNSANLQLKSKEKLELVKIIPTLPIKLQGALGEFKSDSFIDFNTLENSVIQIELQSDIVNLNSSMRLKEPYVIEYSGAIPRHSLLLAMERRLKLQNIRKFDGEVGIYDNDFYNILFQTNLFKFTAEYNHPNGDINGVISTNQEQIYVEGSLDGKIELSANIGNVETFSSTIKKLYAIDIPKVEAEADVHVTLDKDNEIHIKLKSKRFVYENIEGDLDATVDIDANQRVTILLKSRAINYKNSDGSVQKLKALFTKFNLLHDNIEIEEYSIRVRNNAYLNHLYSSKKSYLQYINGKLYSNQFWLNDQIIVSGEYHIANQKGKLYLRADSFDYRHKDFDFLTQFDLGLSIDKGLLFVNGKLKILESDIRYEILGSEISEDSDIIILQEVLKKEESALNHIKAYITIENETPIWYLSNDINVGFLNDMTLIKEYKEDFKLLGTTTIKEGYFQKDDKKFFLNESHIYFYGDPKKPILEIKATYQKEQYDIQIFISGSTDDPIINFNSDPYLTQKEILSLILFDSTGSTSGSGTELYSLLGGTFAKELMKSLGVDVDHLLLGQGIDERLSVEVGQKISNNITIMYQHQDGKDGVKIRVDHSDNFETDIIIQPPNTSSVEFFYKSD